MRPLAKVLLLFVLSYFLLYLLYATQPFLPKWDIFGQSFFSNTPITGYRFFDPLLLLIPIVGFFSAYIAAGWARHHFKDDQVLSLPAGLLYLIASYVVWFLALVGFYWNNAYLSVLAQNTNGHTFS